MTSTTQNKVKIKLWAIIFWLFVWEIIARGIGQEILLVSPIAVFIRFVQLIKEVDFWSTILFSLVRMVVGFLLALTVGTILAAFGAANDFVRDLTVPIIAVIKAAPIASFIILILIWIPSKNLSLVISFLMVLPVIYTNVLSGISQTDKQLLEMATVFRMSLAKKYRYIFIPETMPYFKAACSLSVGLCWKAGIAAEVIGIPKGSIGERLYQAKVYLETPDLFAWTVVVVGLSILCEKFLYLVVGKISLGGDKKSHSLEGTRDKK